MIFSEDHHIEFTKDFSSEKESNEKTEVDEKVYELPEFTFGLISSSFKTKILGTENSILQSKFSSSIPGPPPDHK